MEYQTVFICFKTQGSHSPCGEALTLEPTYSFRDARWDPAGWNSHGSSEILENKHFYIWGRGQGKPTSGYLADQPPLAREKSPWSLCGMVRVGSRGAWLQVWPDLPLHAPPRPHTSTLWVICPLTDFFKKI